MRTIPIVFLLVFLMSDLDCRKQIGLHKKHEKRTAAYENLV